MLSRDGVRSGIVRWSALGAFGLSMAGDLSRAEIVAALAIAVLATALSLAHSRAARRPLRPRAPWARIALTLAAQLAHETMQVAGMLCKSLLWRCRGRIVRLPFPVRPATAGQRALGELMISVAPNGFAVDAPQACAETLRVHRLAPGTVAGRRPQPPSRGRPG